MNQIYKYNGTEITFRLGDGSVMVNATEMARPFRKQPVHWLNLRGSSYFIESLAKLRNRSLADLLIVRQGGDHPGTWMHEDVALEFARWLSPAFAIWCNDKVKELLTRGFTKLDSITRKDLAKWLWETEDEKEKALNQVNILSEKIRNDEPKIVFANSVSGSNGSILIRKYAKDLCDQGFNIGQNRLFQWFRYKGYLNPHNEPYQEYVDRGLFEVITRTIGSGENTLTKKTTKITGKGQVYFANKIKQPIEA